MAGYSNDIKDYIERGLVEVGDLINRREYNSSVVKARKVAGSIISGYAAERNIPADKLADTIEALYSDGAINMTSRDGFHSLRLYGSKAVHDRDCTEEDARNAYYFLNNEVQTYLSRKNVSVDRTPVRIDRSQISSGYGQRSSSQDKTSQQDEEDTYSGTRRTRNTARRRRTSSSQSTRTSGGSSGTRRRASSSRNQSAAASEGGGFGIYDILKVLIPVIVVVLLIIIIRSLLPSDNSKIEATPAVETTASEGAETEAAESEAATEAEPETEAQVYEYRIKGTNVNIRYADNQDRVYTQLSNGYVIGQITEIEGSDFVQFTLDGVSVVVHSDYIEPVTD